MCKKTSCLLALTLLWLNLSLPCYATTMGQLTIIQQTQVLLKWLGYPVKVNGLKDKKTSQGIKAIQRQFRLPVTGKLDGWTFFYLKYLAVTKKGHFSRDDIYLMAKTITAEAGGEPYVGQVAVGAVIVNRLADPRFPKSIKAIVYAPGQFAVTPKLAAIKPTIYAYSAALDALIGIDPSKGAKYFYEPELSTDRWIFTLPIIKTIGHHRFSVN